VQTQKLSRIFTLRLTPQPKQFRAKTERSKDAKSSPDFFFAPSHLCVLLLGQELPNELTFLFVFQASEKFAAQGLDCLGTIKGKALIHHTATKVARLTPLLKDGLYLSLEIDFG